MDSKNLQIGGFNWDLKFIWMPIPKSVANKRKNLAAPIKTPTIAGGLFAINKDFFRYLGYYDEKFEIWGGENLELSFKVWMCGGTLEIVPCSHVGHVYRMTSPYSKTTSKTQDTSKRNSVRLAEVFQKSNYYILVRDNNFPPFLFDFETKSNSPLHKSWKSKTCFISVVSRDISYAFIFVCS